MKQIKAFHVDKNIIYEREKKKKKIQKRKIQKKFGAPSPLFLAYLGITLVLEHQLGKKIIFLES